MSKIYTKKGDLGKTMLGNGKKVWKDDQRIKVYGSLDEVNCWSGLIISQIRSIRQIKQIQNPLFQIQSDLMSICSFLANPDICKGVTLSEKIKHLESLIDKFQKNLPPLKNFILPVGSLISSYLHLFRSTCRRAEREIVSLSKKEKLPPEILIYVNRLSDLLFVLARWTNKKAKQKEIIWRL